MSTATGMWNVGEPPKDGKYYLCRCTFNYGGGRGIERLPVILRWQAEEIFGGWWEWIDPDVEFWGTIEFYAEIEEPT